MSYDLCHMNNFQIIDIHCLIEFSSVQFSRSVESDSSRPYETQHTRPPCPSSTPGVHTDSHTNTHTHLLARPGHARPEARRGPPSPPQPTPSAHRGRSGAASDPRSRTSEGRHRPQPPPHGGYAPFPSDPGSPQGRVRGVLSAGPHPPCTRRSSSLPRRS